MSAELLRQAAKEMRERAEVASPAPWTWDGEQEVGGPDFADGSMRGVAETLYEQDAEHIASWHPAVALAVADLLDREADDLERGGAFTIPGDFEPALAVARAYLGEEAEPS